MFFTILAIISGLTLYLARNPSYSANALIVTSIHFGLAFGVAVAAGAVAAGAVAAGVAVDGYLRKKKCHFNLLVDPRSSLNTTKICDN